jgi:hypothetical protein
MSRFTEARFLLVCCALFDRVCNDADRVANQLMSLFFKEMLNKNTMYNEEDIGDVTEVFITKSGSRELVKHHQAKHLC